MKVVDWVFWEMVEFEWIVFGVIYDEFGWGRIIVGFGFFVMVSFKFEK